MGRKPKNGVKAGVAHDRRPVHVTVRFVDGLPRLRQRRGYQIAQRAIGMANRFARAQRVRATVGRQSGLRTSGQ